jgi:hypothetical protein
VARERNKEKESEGGEEGEKGEWERGIDVLPSQPRLCFKKIRFSFLAHSMLSWGVVYNFIVSFLFADTEMG